MAESKNTEISKEEPPIVEAPSIHTGKAQEEIAVDIVHAAEAEFTPDQYKKLLRKADFILLPLMWVSIYRLHSIHLIGDVKKKKVIRYMSADSRL